MANRFIGGVLGNKPQANIPFASRASTGTYFNSAGTMVTAPVNQPRLNYTYDGASWRTPSLLIEPASTNLLTYSQDFSDNSLWNSSGNGLTLTNNAATAPDGTTTASSFVVSSTQGRFYRTLASTTSTLYTISIFAKPNGKNFLIFRDYFRDGGTSASTWYNVSTGVIGTTTSTTYHLNPTITPVGNGWYRCSVSITGGNGAIQIYVAETDGSYTVTNNSTGLYVWGAQIEQRNGPTSYIPTVASTVTRAADIVGPYSTGIYSLEDEQNSTAIDDQFTVQSFTTIGSTSWTAPADVTSVEVLVVAGGGAGAGGVYNGGGGGAGGLLYNTAYPVTPGTTYPVVVGKGGVGIANKGSNGDNSSFGSIVAIGGGAGGAHPPNSQGGSTGGSGGGGSQSGGAAGPGISGQGNAGGGLVYAAGAGGGGAGSSVITLGMTANPYTYGTAPVSGGVGLQFSISGTATYYAGGGGGGGRSSYSVPQGQGGAGGGGAGGAATGGAGTAGTANTGGGGGGAYADESGSNTQIGGSGGSGIVIIKYRRTPRQISSTSNSAVVVQKFTTTNTWTVPTGVTQVEALVVGGGGGGGNGTAGGGGGAGGVVYSSALSVTPGSTYTIGVGTGGNGGLDQASLPAYSGFGSGIGTGAELITNGNAFTTTTGWTATTATLSVPSTGVFRITPNSGVNGTASQSISTVNGVTYLVTFNVIHDLAKFFRVFIGTTQNGNEIASFFTAYTISNSDYIPQGSGRGTYSTTFTATGSTTWINLQIGGGTGQQTDISYISVRQASLSAFGGGYGGSESGTSSYRNGGNGGSGGGTSYHGVTAGTGVVGQGNAGGTGTSGNNNWTGGGGGGAGSAGGNASRFIPGTGGAGIAYAITGALEYYGGGGAGSSQNSGGGTVYIGLGGIGGGGNGAADPNGSTALKGQDGAPNTGGGGGAQADITGSGGSGNGGSGVVILRYRVPNVATFLDSGTWTCPAGVTSVQALIVGGGGAGGANNAGGGGAGGLVYASSVSVTPGVTYPIVVGQGGLSFNANWSNAGGATGFSGQSSSFANIVAVGGGGGMGGNVGVGGTGNPSIGTNGGSGGGQCRGVGAIPSTCCAGTYGQGNNGGGNRISAEGGGGGGAGSAGFTGDNSTYGGKGGTGLTFSISGTSATYAGGGGGAAEGAGPRAGTGGSGGGGAGAIASGATAAGTWNQNYGQDGVPNTGGGGGAEAAGSASYLTGKGGSGIVILRWSGA